MASISKRQYIRWGSEPPSEPTWTTVLTSAERRFVDIRILREPPADNQGGRNLTSGGDQGDQGGGDDGAAVPAGLLDWAFAGRSRSEPRHDNPAATHSVWAHFVDSRTRHPEAVVDEADMVIVGDQPGMGDPTLAVERGRMVNPATGIETPYEEAWRDEEPVPATAPAASPTSLSHDAPTPPQRSSEADCVVLQLHDDPREARGMVVLLGQHCQGVMRLGGRFALEQWSWQQQDRGHGFAWVRQHRLGDANLQVPCAQLTTKVANLALKSTIDTGGHSWSVVEMSRLPPPSGPGEEAKQA